MAEARATSEITGELRKDSDPAAQSAAFQLENSTAFQSLSMVRGNLYTARTTHKSFMEELWRQIPDGQKPQTSDEITQFMRRANRAFLQGSGLLDKNKRALIAEELAPTMVENARTLLGKWNSDQIKKGEEANKTRVSSMVSTLVDGYKPGDAQELWNKVSDEHAFGGIGHNGRTPASMKRRLFSH